MKIRKLIKNELYETSMLYRCIPATVVSVFVVSIVSMNLLANKTLIQNDWIAIDSGTLISWISFLCMDIITKHFGPSASNRVSVLASGINLFTCAVFYVISIIPSNAGDYTEFNRIFGGTWFILLGSTIAFLTSAVINNRVYYAVGKLFKNNPDSKIAFLTQSYVSTFVGQFVDNLLFSIIVFMGFAPIFWDGFSWTFLQCTTCAFTGAVVELLMEAAFSPLGYKIVTNWKKYNVGKEYFEYKGIEFNQNT